MKSKKQWLAVMLASGLLALAACTKNETAPEATDTNTMTTTGDTATTDTGAVDGATADGAMETSPEASPSPMASPEAN